MTIPVRKENARGINPVRGSGRWRESWRECKISVRLGMAGLEKDLASLGNARLLGLERLRERGWVRLSGIPLSSSFNEVSTLKMELQDSGKLALVIL